MEEHLFFAIIWTIYRILRQKNCRMRKKGKEDALKVYDICGRVLAKDFRW